MISYRKESDEVLYPGSDPLLSRMDIDELKRLAVLNPRQRIRFCAHTTLSDSLHEMFIVHTKSCYVRPHRHLGKAESISVLEGEVDLVLFNADGSVIKVVDMGPPASGKPFYHRLSTPVYHMLLIRTEFLVFHEITEGPFMRAQTEFPDWAPEENSPESMDFVSQLQKKISQK